MPVTGVTKHISPLQTKWQPLTLNRDHPWPRAYHLVPRFGASPARISGDVTRVHRWRHARHALTFVCFSCLYRATETGLWLACLVLHQAPGGIALARVGPDLQAPSRGTAWKRVTITVPSSRLPLAARTNQRQGNGRDRGLIGPCSSSLPKRPGCSVYALNFLW